MGLDLVDREASLPVEVDQARQERGRVGVAESGALDSATPDDLPGVQLDGRSGSDTGQDAVTGLGQTSTANRMMAGLPVASRL